MNDMNREEVSRYVDIDRCHYIIDLETPDTAPLEPNYSVMTDRWKTIHSEKFLIAKHSNNFFRAFYIPLLSEKYCFYGRYNVLEKIR